MRTDVLIDFTDNLPDLEFQNGDFKIDDSSYQEISIILNYGPGHQRNYPDLGVHIDIFKQGIWNIELKQKIIRELKKDGYSGSIIKTLIEDFKNSKINILTNGN